MSQELDEDEDQNVLRVLSDTWQHCLHVQAKLDLSTSSEAYRICMRLVREDRAVKRSGTRTIYEITNGEKSSNLTEFKLKAKRESSALERLKTTSE